NVALQRQKLLQGSQAALSGEGRPKDHLFGVGEGEIRDQDRPGFSLTQPRALRRAPLLREEVVQRRTTAPHRVSFDQVFFDQEGALQKLHREAGVQGGLIRLLAAGKLVAQKDKSGAQAFSATQGKL